MKTIPKPNAKRDPACHDACVELLPWQCNFSVNASDKYLVSKLVSCKLCNCASMRIVSITLVELRMENNSELSDTHVGQNWNLSGG